MRFLKPIKDEEWIEEKRKDEFWISKKQSYPQKFYARLCKSYIGWWLHMRLHFTWSRAALLFDPLSSGGLWSHIHCFFYNAVIVDLWWGLKRKVWKTFHRKEWQQEMEFDHACMKALMEGCHTDKVDAPSGFPAERFHGVMLGERYFKRVAEILKEKPN